MNQKTDDKKTEEDNNKQDDEIKSIEEENVNDNLFWYVASGFLVILFGIMAIIIRRKID